MSTSTKLRQLEQVLKNALEAVQEVRLDLTGDKEYLPKTATGAVKKGKKNRKYYIATEEFKKKLDDLYVGQVVQITNDDYAGSNLSAFLQTYRHNTGRKVGQAKTRGGYTLTRHS